MEPVSMIQDEHIQTLMKFGLTFLQAKTYLAVAKLGKAKVKTIAEASNVARQDVYRVMPTLEKLGLAEKIVATPIMYKAIPLKTGLSILFQHREEENAKLQKKTKELINNFQEDNASIALHEEDSQFIITSEKTLFRERFEKGIQVAQTNIDIIAFPLKVCKEMIFHHFQGFKRAMEKGVKIRTITEETKDESIPRPRAIRVLKKNRFFKLKYLSAPVPVTMAIFDGKEVNIRMTSSIVPNLWSNDPNIVKLTTSYFDDLWNKAQSNPSLSKTRKGALRAEAQNRSNCRQQILSTQQS